jgi:hypothetical protein
MRKYIVLVIAVAIIYFLQTFFNATGGIGADSLSYFGIASDLPHLKTNLFPLGFPILLESFHRIFNDYFWAGKMLNITMVLSVLLFSYFKKFYFRETILLFAGKTLFFAFNYICSEGPFVFLLYFMMYFFHERFEEKIKSNTFIIGVSLILVLLLTVRYSGIYIYLGVGIFWLIMVLRKKTFPLRKNVFTVLLLSGIGIAAYLGLNYFIYHSFTGENLRGAPVAYHSVYILRDILGVISIFDPFIGLKPASNSIVSISFQIGLMIVDLLLLRYFIKLVKRKKESVNFQFHQLLWVISGVYAIAVFVSGYFQQIEEMNLRMMAAANFCLFFSFLIIYFKDLKSDVFIFRLGCFFLLFLTAYSLKTPVNYFNNREQIEAQMPKFNDRKYLYNNDKNEKDALTIYHIPIVNKTFQYKHTNNQVGDVKYSIAGTINPQIKWLKYDTIKKKSEVLYSSELNLK